MSVKTWSCCKKKKETSLLNLKIYHWTENMLQYRKKCTKFLFRISTRKDNKGSSIGKGPVQNLPQPSSLCSRHLWFDYFFLESPRFPIYHSLIMSVLYKTTHSAKMSQSIIYFSSFLFPFLFISLPLSPTPLPLFPTLPLSPFLSFPSSLPPSLMHI